MNPPIIETFLNNRVTLHPSDCLDILTRLEECSIDACVTDPPYHLTSIVKRFGAENAAPAKVGKTGAYARASAGFMGKQWDGGDIAFNPDTWRAVLRVLKPGAHLVAFGGTRTFARMSVAIEDAGFEIRDTVMWLYGSGFPKSLDVSKAIDKAAGAEREIAGPRRWAGRDPNGTALGRMNDDAWEAKPDAALADTAPATDAARQWSGFGTALKPACEPIVLARKPLEGTVAQNVLKWGTGGLNIDGCRVATDESTLRPMGELTSKGLPGGGFGAHERLGNRPIVGIGGSENGRWPANVIHDGSEEVVGAFPESGNGNGAPTIAKRERNKRWCNSSPGEGVNAIDNYGDSGSAARFFYTSKADADDRLGSKHPTVKPLDLMQYLVRLVTPPSGLVLDPFAGTGTTGEAAFREGMRAILIEREAEYQNDIRRRMALVLSGSGERTREASKARMKGKPDDHGPLFAPANAEPKTEPKGEAA